MSYLYTGTGARTYRDYVDESTGKMLTAQPGQQYEIRATWDKLPVPPEDGFWAILEPVTAGDEAEPATKVKRRTPGA